MLNGKVVAIIQARMGSTRLPGKVMEKIGEKPLLEILVSRLRKSKNLDEIIIATTKKKVDDTIVALSSDLGIKFYRGSEEDVLDRYVKAASLFNASIVVRVTGDNPLTDPQLTDKLIEAHIKNESDYTCCDDAIIGTSVEVINVSALTDANVNAKLQSDREHVTPYIKFNPTMFKIQKVEYPLNNKNLRLTVDTEEDLKLIKSIYIKLGPLENLEIKDLIDFLEKNPQIRDLNSSIKQTPLNSNLKEVKITVIIRTHNSENFVNRAINSVLNQTLPNNLYEILVVDDGSIDNTRNMLLSYGDKIRFIKKKNLGPIKAINVGIREARGKYFVLLDSDDTFEVNALEEWLSAIEKDKYDFVCSDYYELNDEKNEVKTVSLRDNIFNSVAGGIIFKKSSVDALNGYDEKFFFPEYDLLIKLIKNDCKYHYVEKPLFTYFRHNESLTANKEAVKKGFEQLFNKYGYIKGLRRY